MIASDAIRAALLLSIPATAVAGTLRIEQLYVVAFLEAGFGTAFDIAYRTYLPSLLPADRLLEGNAKIGMTGAFAEIGGPGLAGSLVQTITAPMAMLVDAVSYVFSAVTIATIRTPEGRVEHVGGPAGLRRQLAEGFAIVAHHPLLRPMALASVISGLFGNFYASLYALYGLNELGLSPLLLGVVVSAGGVGSLAASALVGPVTRRLGFGPAIVWTCVGARGLGILTPLAGGPPLVAALFLLVPQLFGDGLLTISQIDELTVRQQVTPSGLLGRVNATVHLLVEGVAPIGALAGAALAESIGLRGAIWISFVGSLAGVGFLVVSPVRRLRSVATP
jgi:hypothetical protein